MNATPVSFVLLALAIPLVACADDTDRTNESADCGAKLLYRDVVYRPVVSPHLPAADQAGGRAGYVGCDEVPAPDLGRVDVSTISRVDPGTGILAGEQSGNSLYVADGLQETRWPQTVMDATEQVVCERPMEFTGTWKSIDNDAAPDGDRFDVPLPYDARFTAWKSDSLDPRWASIEFTARVSEQTQPAPSATVAEEAIDGGQAVEVAVGCTDGKFEVTSLRLADRSS
jgi:hypothetical protein